jgi:hypothetical protein
MYTREQASQLRQEFWTTFGQYIAPKLSSGGNKINWLNYKTGLKHVYFKMDADKSKARIAIEITHPDSGMQELFFQQFEEFRDLLHSAVNEVWDWELHTLNEEGKIICRVGTLLNEVNIFKKDDWPKLISFFKPRIIALDEFWGDVKDGFESLK